MLVTRLRWPIVLFDLDGTVANTIPLIVASYRKALKSVLGAEVEEPVIRRWIGRTLADVCVEIAPDQADELVAEYTHHNLTHLTEMIEPYPGVGALVDELRQAGATVGIVTSKRRMSAEASLAAVGLFGLAPIIGAMEDSVEHKPHPEPLLNAMDALGAAPADVVYVGDAVYDVLAAKAAGAGAAVGVTWGAGVPGDLAEAGADAVCDTVQGLREVLLDGAHQTLTG